MKALSMVYLSLIVMALVGATGCGSSSGPTNDGDGETEGEASDLDLESAESDTSDADKELADTDAAGNLDRLPHQSVDLVHGHARRRAHDG